jgi:uncharacterized damage-inducible protein DinB
VITTQTAQLLARYNRWANRVIFEAVKALPEGEAGMRRQSQFRNMIHTLNHSYIIDTFWQAQLDGREHGFTALNTPGHPSLDELWRMQREIDAWYVAWSERMTDATLAEVMRFTSIGGIRGVMPRGWAMFQVVNHTSYHRGFVADLFYQVPARAPATDLPVYLREAEPGHPPGSGIIFSPPARA